jgi:hypothetical protein
MMEHKIFASYRFTDDQVANLAGQSNSIVRDYVDKLESLLAPSCHIYKVEYSGENPSEETVWDKLRDRILDSTMTIIFISPGMIAQGVEEKDQWIPWEVSFSLRKTERKRPNGDTYTGSPNAMLAVVLPDVYGSYDYYLQRSTCCGKGCTIYHNHRIFGIMRDNMFNRKAEDKHICDIHSTIWRGEHSYIRSVRWSDFIENPETYITAAYERQKHTEDYDIHINI